MTAIWPPCDRQVRIGRDLSLVGIGRSADASAYYVPELGICLDAGLHVKSLSPKCVLLTHGHRDHTAALPAMAQRARVYAPRPIVPLVRRFLLAEAQLNYGDASQTDEQTVEALGEFDVEPVDDKDEAREPGPNPPAAAAARAAAATADLPAPCNRHVTAM